MLSLAAGAPLIGLGVPGGGEVDSATQGIMVRLMWGRPHSNAPQAIGTPRLSEKYVPVPEQWCVAVLDWENRGPDWRPGRTVPWKNVALTEFLKEAEADFLAPPATV